MTVRRSEHAEMFFFLSPMCQTHIGASASGEVRQSLQVHEYSALHVQGGLQFEPIELHIK